MTDAEFSSSCLRNFCPRSCLYPSLHWRLHKEQVGTEAAVAGVVRPRWNMSSHLRSSGDQYAAEPLGNGWEVLMALFLKICFSCRKIKRFSSVSESRECLWSFVKIFLFVTEKGKYLQGISSQSHWDFCSYRYGYIDVAMLISFGKRNVF